VQLEMKRRKAFAEKYNISKIDYATIDNPFAGRVICGQCGSAFGRKVWNSTDERLRRFIWRCNNKYAVKGKKSCTNKHIDDKVLYQAFINTFNAMIENKNYFIEKWKEGLIRPAN
jgi:site-specific DNA recombinase